jgi:hypothetical protein
MTSTLPKNWLDVAVNKASTKWLEQFIRRYLALLEKEQITPHELANELEEEFASRMLDTPKKQKNYRSNVVQALKLLDEQHPAIPLVTLSTEEYRRLNDEQRGRVAQRETQYLHPDAAETLVEMAENLLESDEWSDVGAGLAVLIGRRISEILLSKFSLKSPWSLNFSQMAKKADDVDITIEIPTLAPAEKVLAAIKKLQSGLAIADLRKLGASSRQLKLAVNRRYSLAISQKCDEYFSGLVPNRSDKDNLYTHIFRAVYATIAAHWFCPPNVPEHQYKAEIQGHFTMTQDGEKLPNYAARSNYDDYAIGDGQGNRDGRLGIKLGQWPGLEVIAAFRDDPVEESLPKADEIDDTAAESSPTTTDTDAAIEVTEEEPQMSKSPEQPIKRPKVYEDDLERLVQLMAQEGMTGSPAELFCGLLDAYEALKREQQSRQTETVGEVAQTFNWFTKQLDALTAQNQVLEQERDRLQAQQPQTLDTEKLREMAAENAQLKRELAEAKQQLEGIYKVLGQPVPSRNEAAGAAAPTPTPAPEATPTATAAVTVSPAATPAEDASPQTATRQRDRSDSKTKVEAIVQDIINWNTAQESNDTRLRISVSIIKALGGLVGATYQPVIMEVLKEQEAAIEEVHRRFMIGTRHNVSVDKDAILKDIARDYMGVENWQEAAY